MRSIKKIFIMDTNIVQTQLIYDETAHLLPTMCLSVFNLMVDLEELFVATNLFYSFLTCLREHEVGKIMYEKEEERIKHTSL